VKEKKRCQKNKKIVNDGFLEEKLDFIDKIYNTYNKTL